MFVAHHAERRRLRTLAATGSAWTAVPSDKRDRVWRRAVSHFPGCGNPANSATPCIPSMNTKTYPGQGLSISQLIFALNEKLKQTAYSLSYVTKDHRCLDDAECADFQCSSTYDQVSRFDQDTSTALATIREWRNSLTRINRIPFDILSLIPTHLHSQRDRLRASFVCRHWRRTFLQCPELWSQLYLSKGEAYVKTLLERAKRSPLDVTVGYGTPAPTMMLLSSHTEQIKNLDFSYNLWQDVRNFSEVNPGPFPLLHTLGIVGTGGGGPDDAIAPPSPLFGNATNVRVFLFRSSWARSPSFRRFVFPNLVSFDLSAAPWESFRVLGLLDFLEASPMLQTVRMKIFGDLSLEGVPQERVVVLPRMENLILTVNGGGPSYEIATHISSPSARHTSLKHTKLAEDVTPDEVFPPSVPWKTIVRQYTRSPAEEVTLETMAGRVVKCKLTFRSSDGTTIRLCSKVDQEEDEHEVYLPSEIRDKVFTQAINTIQNHPQLAHVKRLHIPHNFRSADGTFTSRVADETRLLLASMGPLDELTIHRCNPRVYFDPFFYVPGVHTGGSNMLPQIKELTISHPLYTSHWQCTAAIVELAQTQRTRGMPFECVTIRGECMPSGMEERLRPLVGSVRYCYDALRETDDV
jgi:hypothetical protein